LISVVNTDIEVLILQHPLEVTETKGTARLLHLCLPNSQLLIGEVFDELALTSTKQSVLLYPITTEDYSLGISAPPELNTAVFTDLANTRLIIIDGTWRKSRKILCKNQYLQTLPRWLLKDIAPGQYSIRKARKPHQLSTMEATSAALAQMDADPTKFMPLDNAFTAFNTMLEAQMRR
jgi:DTW domain-containing protein YfiP